MYTIIIKGKKYIIKNGQLVPIEENQQNQENQTQEINQQIENLVNKKKQQLQ